MKLKILSALVLASVSLSAIGEEVKTETSDIVKIIAGEKLCMLRYPNQFDIFKYQYIVDKQEIKRIDPTIPEAHLAKLFRENYLDWAKPENRKNHLDFCNTKKHEIEYYTSEVVHATTDSPWNFVN